MDWAGFRAGPFLLAVDREQEAQPEMFKPTARTPVPTDAANSGRCFNDIQAPQVDTRPDAIQTLT